MVSTCACPEPNGQNIRIYHHSSRHTAGSRFGNAADCSMEFGCCLPDYWCPKPLQFLRGVFASCSRSAVAYAIISGLQSNHELFYKRACLDLAFVRHVPPVQMFSAALAKCALSAHCRLLGWRRSSCCARCDASVNPTRSIIKAMYLFFWLVNSSAARRWHW